jgi:Ni/Fe-hydrogenase subunit HybB-like protein
MHESKHLGGTILTKPFKALMGIALFAGVLIAIRYVLGIGAVSNMSDGFPWGIWITYDVLVGTALGCGGYAVAILVYALNKWEYHPLVRPATLTSVFGYTLAGVSILIDIGRYWQPWNLILPWYANVNSIMFEVAVCVMTYTFVLWIELAPALLEGYRHALGTVPEKSRKLIPSFLAKFDPTALYTKLNKGIFIAVAVGILLPTMHQSSLGSLMIIAGRKVHPLWQSAALLPLLFLISAIMMGYAVVVFESILSSIGFKRPMETDILAKLSGILPWLAGAYLVIRFGDVLWRGQIGTAVTSGFLSFMFIVENVLYIVPAVLLASARNRTSPRMLFLSALLLLLAGSFYRFNAFLVAFNPGPGWSYFPSFGEIVITFGVVSVELMAYLVIVKRFPVLPKAEHA